MSAAPIAWPGPAIPRVSRTSWSWRGRSPPATALDHLLIGRELAANRQWREAITMLQTALRLEPDQASAKLLLAICEYNVQPKRLDEALSNLNDCIGSHSELVGLYLLRALVHGELAYQALSQIDHGRPAESASRSGARPRPRSSRPRPTTGRHSIATRATTSTTRFWSTGAACCSGPAGSMSRLPTWKPPSG